MRVKGQNLSFLMIAILFLSFLISCNKEAGKEESIPESQIEENRCVNPSNVIFNEEDGLVTVEFEKAEFSEDWTKKSDGNGFSGDGYMVWEGEQNLGNPGKGSASYKIKIENAGTYQFLWKSAVKMGNSGSDHNDTWLRFNDASDFYAERENSVVYPKDTGKTPNPAGASKDGWFKIYRSGNDLDFKWQASTFDHNGHDIYVDFENAGIYTMEISARSSGHGIDKFVLFNDAFTKAEATAETNTSSAITCN